MIGKYILGVLDMLLLSPVGGPGDVDKGISVSADSPRKKSNVKMCQDRNVPVRQSFGRKINSDPETLPQDHVCVHTYGSGSGKSTVGTPQQ